MVREGGGSLGPGINLMQELHVYLAWSFFAFDEGRVPKYGYLRNAWLGTRSA
jgi:hypothetical protein